MVSTVPDRGKSIRRGGKWAWARAGSMAFILTANSALAETMRMRVRRRHPIMLSGVDCRLMQYDIHVGAPLHPGNAGTPEAPYKVDRAMESLQAT